MAEQYTEVDPVAFKEEVLAKYPAKLAKKRGKQFVVNKVESGVRLRYQYEDPDTGEKEEILIENTETRDQPKNKENAMRQLRSILYDKELQHRLQEQAKIEAGKMKIEWGSQIRSYVFDDRRVKDHRTGSEAGDVEAVLNGQIDQFQHDYLLHRHEQQR